MISIQYVSELNPSGYGVAGRGYIRALVEAGARVSWAPMAPGPAWGLYLQPHQGPLPPDEPLAAFYNQPLAPDAVLVHLIPEYFEAWRKRLRPGQKVIGVTVWEKDGVPPRLAENLKYVDGLIVPCRWNEQSFRHAGLATPLAVAPHAPLPSPAALDAPFEISGAQPGDFLFYTIGEWKDRKGLPLPVEAFCRAFTARDPVCLVVKTGLVNECRRQRGRWWWHVTRHIETSLRDLARIRARHQNPPRIAALTGSIPAAAIHSLHQRADCYVSLTRAEGWALGAYEAAFAGKPVMITGHGGQLDFLPQDLAYHVNYRLIDAQPQGLHDQHFRGKTWADPNLDHAVELMREVFSNPEKARLRGQGLQAFVNSTFQPAAIGHGILEFIRKVRVN